MIIRLWHGRTSTSDYQAYSDFMLNRAIPDYKSIEGNLACYFCRRLETDAAHFLLITHWQSIEAVSTFAGEDPAVAKYYPQDDDYLLEKEKNCHLYEVFHESVTSLN